MPNLVDTIVALATAPGRGALAVVRLSGPRALELARAVAPELPPEPEARRVHLVRVEDPRSGEVIDQGLMTWFRSPASYTGEDVMEFSGHGGALTPRLVVEALCRAGARLAEPGEFTRRAYLHGKLDLIQAEAVGDLVESSSTALHREALRQLDRHLSRRLAALRDGLVGVEAVLAHHIDFPDEDDPPVPTADIAARADGLARDLAALAATAPEGERLRNGALVVLAGRTNAGKSSLYNALVGEERALVTDVPGTTRDALEAQISLRGFPVRLVDTAGLRDPEELVERLGIEVARRFVNHADLVLHCVPVGSRAAAEETEWLTSLGVRVLRVETMADLAPGTGGGGNRLRLSVVTGEGLGDLQTAIVEHVFAGVRDRPDDVPVLLRRRQARSVEEARVEVGAFADALRAGVPPEYAATHLKAAASRLEEVLGIVDTDEVLDRLFSSFCVGK